MLVVFQVSKRGSFFRSYERTFFLFSDVLMYAKPRLLEGATGGGVRGWASGAGRCSASSPSLICCCIMPLHHCHVERVLGHPHGNDEQGSLFTVSMIVYSHTFWYDEWGFLFTDSSQELLKTFVQSFSYATYFIYKHILDVFIIIIAIHMFPIEPLDIFL